jgi:hypothetical protein
MWNTELTRNIYLSKGALSMSHQTGQSHLRALSVQFAQLTTSGDAHAGLFLKAGQLLSRWFLK